MTHIVKLCVGISTVEELESYRRMRFAEGSAYGPNVHVHRTRMMPRRAEEVVATGSLYWVIAGEIRCRQKILALEAATDHEGRSCCDIVMHPDLVRTVPRPKRPFQGWRYFRPEDAPADMAHGADTGDEELAAELSRLGLI
jgi:hypothetical protein